MSKPVSWIDADGMRRCSGTERTDMRPSFVAIHSQGMMTVVAHQSIRFEIEEGRIDPVKVVSRSAPALSEEGE